MKMSFFSCRRAEFSLQCSAYLTPAEPSVKRLTWPMYVKAFPTNSDATDLHASTSAACGYLRVCADSYDNKNTSKLPTKPTSLFFQSAAIHEEESFKKYIYILFYFTFLFRFPLVFESSKNIACAIIADGFPATC